MHIRCCVRNKSRHWLKMEIIVCQTLSPISFEIYFFRLSWLHVYEMTKADFVCHFVRFFSFVYIIKALIHFVRSTVCSERTIKTGSYCMLLLLNYTNCNKCLWNLSFVWMINSVSFVIISSSPSGNRQNDGEIRWKKHRIHNLIFKWAKRRASIKF